MAFSENLNKIFRLQALFLSDPSCLLHYILKCLYLQECNDQKYPSIYARVDDYNNLHFIRDKAFNEDIAKPDGINGMYLQKHTFNTERLLSARLRYIPLIPSGLAIFSLNAFSLIKCKLLYSSTLA